MMTAQEGAAVMRRDCITDANSLLRRAAQAEDPKQREIMADIAVKCLMVGSHATHDPFGSLGLLS